MFKNIDRNGNFRWSNSNGDMLFYDVLAECWTIRFNADVEDKQFVTFVRAFSALQENEGA